MKNCNNRRRDYIEEIIIDERAFAVGQMVRYGHGENGNIMIIFSWMYSVNGSEILITLNLDGEVTNAVDIRSEEGKELFQFVEESYFDGDEILFNGDTFDEWLYQYSWRKVPEDEVPE